MLAQPELLEAPVSARRGLERHVGEEAVVWAAFAGAQSAKEFCQAWLTIQCGGMPGAVSGLLLIEEEASRFSTAASWPDARADLDTLAPAAEQALLQRRGLVHATAGMTHVAYPIDVGGRLHGVAVINVGARDAAEVPALLRQLHWGVGWLETLFRRRQADESTALAARTTFALDMLADASEHRHCNEAALAVVNALATRLACRRVSLGLVRRDTVRLAAISHTAIFEEKAHVGAAIANAMDEARDQGASVALPEVPRTARRIALAHRDLARLSGAQSVASVVMTSAGRAVGVVTLERDTGEIFDDRTVQLLEAVAVLLGPVFELKAEARRLVAGRVVDRTGSFLTALVGPRRPGLKLATLAVLIAVAGLALGRGDFRVSAKAVVEGAIQRAAVAPFDGFVASASARAGDVVDEGQRLARLDDHELRLEAIRWRSEVEQQVLKYNDALGKHDRPAARIAQATIDEAQAQLSQVEDKLARAEIVAPFRAVIVSGDLSQMIGSPIEKGKVLFEVAPLDAFRVILQADERDVALLETGQAGELVLTGLTHASFRFHVKTVTPVATAQDGRNFFRVEADVDDPERRLRPGMEGIGKVSIEERPLLAIWTRSLVEWVRITAWKWWP